MKSKKIRIDKINIRTKGISPNQIQSSIHGIDRELLYGFVRRRELKESNKIRINKLESENIKITSHVGSSELRESIVKSILKSLSMQGRSFSKV